MLNVDKRNVTLQERHNSSQKIYQYDREGLVGKWFMPYLFSRRTNSIDRENTDNIFYRELSAKSVRLDKDFQISNTLFKSRFNRGQWFTPNGRISDLT